jgi:CRP-like cAMP-binding protein
VEFRNFLLSSISNADMQIIAPALSEVSLRRGEVLFEVGDRVSSVYFPSSAVLSVVTIMRDGRTAESNTIGREGGAGLLAAASGAVTQQRIFVQVPGGAIRLSSEVVRHRLEHSPAFAKLLFRHAFAEAAQIQQFVACNVLHAAEQRLARWLLMTADRTGADSFDLTQDYMAVMTGVQRTTISALASDFKARGLIRYSRGSVDILNRLGLKAAACECADVAHQLFIARDEG